MIGAVIAPLTEIKGTGRFVLPTRSDRDLRATYVVLCRECGDVTRTEGGSTEAVPLQQAALYQQRHLARHLSALANEFQEATR